MNDTNSQNNQGLNNQQNSQVDPNFLPKDSNVYIRTMKEDLNNLKEKGGENLPYIEKPANVNDFSNTLQNGQNTMPNEPQTVPPQTPEPSYDAEKKPENVFGNQDFNMPKVEQTPQMPEMPNAQQPESVEQNTFDSQNFGVPNNVGSFNNQDSQMDKKPEDIFGNQDFNMPKVEQTPQMSEMPNAQQPESVEQNTFDSQNFGVPNNESLGSVNNIKDKIKELNTDPNAKPIDSRPGNWNDDMNNQDLNNLITPEEFNPMSNININEHQPKKKNKLTLIVGLLVIVIAIVLVFMFVIRPKMLAPNVSLKTTEGQDMLLNPPTSQPPTTKASPFIALKNGFQLNNLAIDISKSPEIVEQINKEASNLLPPGTFKVIVPKIKDQYLSASEVSIAFIENTPTSLTNNLENKYILYSFYGEIHPSLGIVFQVKNDSIEQIKAEFRSWETNRDIIKDTLNMWLFSPKTPIAKSFKDGEYLGANIRYFDYPEEEAALSYAFYQNNVIISTSVESISAAINYLQNGDTPIIR